MSKKSKDDKRKNKLTDGESPTSDYCSQNGTGIGGSHFNIIDDFIGSEENYLNAFCNILMQVIFKLSFQTFQGFFNKINLKFNMQYLHQSRRRPNFFDSLKILLVQKVE